MKRYLVTLTGRTNLIVRAMRDHDVCDCYVYANSQKEAISKFWEQLEKNPHLSSYTRRDFKITAERWEKGELNMYGEPMSDLESAIPFDLLAVAEWKKDHSYKLTAPETAPETEEKEMNQPEPEKVTESHTEPQKAKSSHQVISRDQINAWNRLVNEIAGTNLWHRFSLQKEYKDGSRWVYLTHNASIRACYKEQTGERFFVKITKGGLYGESYFWLYWENCAGTESERWLLNDLARDFFGC